MPEATEGQETAEPAETAEPDESSAPKTTTGTESTGSATNDNCTTDPTNLIGAQLAALTHGSIVCWAAHQPTPAGYANHGAWVSHWAKQNAGHGAGHSHKP